MTQISLKRTYDGQAADDGYRILVDRLWPQGLSHENFHYDMWAKDIAPSTELRHELHADPSANEAAFARAYTAELHANPEFPAFVAAVASHPKVTFLYSSRNTVDNNAVVLRQAVMAAMARK